MADEQLITPEELTEIATKLGIDAEKLNPAIAGPAQVKKAG